MLRRQRVRPKRSPTVRRVVPAVHAHRRTYVTAVRLRQHAGVVPQHTRRGIGAIRDWKYRRGTLRTGVSYGLRARHLRIPHGPRGLYDVP
jgi:hypothetical protein